MRAPLSPVTLVGSVVRLEPLTSDHTAALDEAANEDRANYQWSRVPGADIETPAYVEHAAEMHASGTALPFATVRLSDERVVGSTRFLDAEFWSWPPGHPLVREDGAPDAVEIGYTWLASSAQRTPINTEAKLLMLRHAFETWRVHRVHLRTDRRNERSRAAILRIGAQFEGVRRLYEPGSDGTIRDTAFFSILASEWPSVEERLRGLLAR